MNKPLMIQSKVQKKERIERWKAVVRSISIESAAINKEFQKHSRLKALPDLK